MRSIYSLFYLQAPQAFSAIFFLIYAGPGQFQWLVDSPLWGLFSNAWFCAALALALNSAAYSTQLFHGAVKAISKGQWESCAALG